MHYKPSLTTSEMGRVRCRFLFTFRLLLFISEGSSKAYADEPKSVAIDGLLYTILSETDHTASVKTEKYGIYGDIQIKGQVTINGNVYAVTTIENNAFNFGSEITSVSIPNTVSTIGAYAFYSCTNIQSVTIPEGVKEIQNDAFWDCTSLAKVHLPSTLTKIGERVFCNCPSLLSIEIEVGNPVYEVIWGLLVEHVFENGNIVETKTLTYTGIELTVQVPEGITTIGEYTFYGSNMMAIILPNTVTKINGNAFRLCENLMSINLPNSLVYFDVFAMYKCNKLSSITFPSGVKTLGWQSFNDAENLKNIYINNPRTDMSWYGTQNTQASVTYSSDAAPDGSKTVIIPDCATAQCTNCAGSFGNRVYVKDDNAEIILDELENGFSYIASPFDGCFIDGNKITEITKDIVISLAAHEMQYRLEGDEVFVSARIRKFGAKSLFLRKFLSVMKYTRLRELTSKASVTAQVSPK